MRQLPSSFAVALGLCFILPLLNYFRDPPMGDFFGEWSSAVVMGLGALLMVRALPQRLLISGALLALPAVLVVLILIQAALGRYVYLTDAFLYVCYLAMFVLVVLLGQHFRCDGLAVEVVKRMAWAMVLVGLVNFAAQIAQLGRWDVQLQPWVVKLPGESVCALYGNTGQSNQTSAIAWLALLSSLYLAHERRMPVWVLPVLAAIFMSSSAATASRMAWLFLGFSVLGVLSFRPNWVQSLKGQVTLAAALVAAFVVMTAGVGALIGAIEPACKSSFARLADGQEAGIAARLDYLKQALLVWMHNPWIGVGAASINGTAYQLIADGRSQPLDAYSHNIVAQLLAEFGSVGALTLIVLVMVFIAAIWRNRHQLGAADALLLAWIGVIGIHSLFEYPLWYVHFLMFFGLSLGLLVRPEWRVLALQLPARWLVGGLSAATLAVCMVLFNDYRSLDRLMFLVMEKVDNRIASSPQVDALLDGANLDVLIYRKQADHMFGVAMPLTREKLSEKVAATEKLLSRAPTPPTIARRAVLSVLEGDLVTARYHLDRLYQFFPGPAAELAKQMDLMAIERPEELGPLVGLIDGAAANAPKRHR